MSSTTAWPVSGTYSLSDCVVGVVELRGRAGSVEPEVKEGNSCCCASVLPVVALRGWARREGGRERSTIVP